MKYTVSLEAAVRGHRDDHAPDPADAHGIVRYEREIVGNGMAFAEHGTDVHET